MKNLYYIDENVNGETLTFDEGEALKLSDEFMFIDEYAKGLFLSVEGEECEEPQDFFVLKDDSIEEMKYCEDSEALLDYLCSINNVVDLAGLTCDDIFESFEQKGYVIYSRL